MEKKSKYLPADYKNHDFYWKLKKGAFLKLAFEWHAYWHKNQAFQVVEQNLISDKLTNSIIFAQ